MNDFEHGIVVAMTGASGAAYGLRLIQRLGKVGIQQHILISDAARVVLRQELDIVLPVLPGQVGDFLTQHLDIGKKDMQCYALDDWFSPVASGSAGIRHMVVVPCSMGTLARISTGASDNLIERAADVMIKEGRRLILMPRETPLSPIHLEHMLSLTRMGVHMIPAMPGFYHRPECISDLVDFMVDRLLSHLGIEDKESKRWGG